MSFGLGLTNSGTKCLRSGNSFTGDFPLFLVGVFMIRDRRVDTEFICGFILGFLIGLRLDTGLLSNLYVFAMYGLERRVFGLVDFFPNKSETFVICGGGSLIGLSVIETSVAELLLAEANRVGLYSRIFIGDLFAFCGIAGFDGTGTIVLTFISEFFLVSSSITDGVEQLDDTEDGVVVDDDDDDNELLLIGVSGDWNATFFEQLAATFALAVRICVVVFILESAFNFSAANLKRFNAI